MWKSASHRDLEATNTHSQTAPANQDTAGCKQRSEIQYTSFRQKQQLPSNLCQISELMDPCQNVQSYLIALFNQIMMVQLKLTFRQATLHNESHLTNFMCGLNKNRYCHMITINV